MKKFALFLAIAAVCVASFFLIERQSTPPAEPARVSAPALSAAEIEALTHQAEGGDVNAQLTLGRHFATANGRLPNYTIAAKWYRQAAAGGNAQAQAALGELCEAGQGVPRDFAAATDWYRRAAEQGLASAQYNLGFMFEKGRGQAANQIEAAKWFRLAAEGGEPLAQFDLGQRYALGVGVPQDLVEAWQWLSLALAQGQADAPAKLDLIKGKMTGQQLSEAARRVAAFVPRKPGARVPQ